MLANIIDCDFCAQSMDAKTKYTVQSEERRWGNHFNSGKTLIKCDTGKHGFVSELRHTASLFTLQSDHTLKLDVNDMSYISKQNGDMQEELSFHKTSKENEMKDKTNQMINSSLGDSTSTRLENITCKVAFM